VYLFLILILQIRHRYAYVYTNINFSIFIVVFVNWHHHRASFLAVICDHFMQTSHSRLLNDDDLLLISVITAEQLY